MNLSSPLATLLIASKGQAPEITGPHILIRNKLMSILQDRNEEIILSKPILVSLEEICPDSGTFIMQSITADAVFSECLPRGKSFPSYREGRRPDLSNRTREAGRVYWWRRERWREYIQMRGGKSGHTEKWINMKGFFLLKTQIFEIKYFQISF